MFGWRRAHYPLSHLLVKVAVLVVVILLAFYGATFVRENTAVHDLVAHYGYIGLFFVALVSGFNLAVPIPAVAFLPLFLSAGLSFWPSVFLIAVGTTCADSIAYFVGHVGRQAVHHVTHDGWAARLERIQKRHPRWPLLVLFLFASLAPLPNETLIVPLAFIGYKTHYLIPVVFLGNFVFTVLYAMGIVSIFNLF